MSNTYRIDFEYEDISLRAELRKTVSNSPNARVIVGDYRIVEASSVWQALVILGAAITLPVEDFQNVSNPNLCYSSPYQFKILSVNAAEWNSETGWKSPADSLSNT